MAITNTATLQTELDENLNSAGITAENLGSPSPIKILQEAHDADTYSRWYCVGNATDMDITDASSRVQTQAPKSMWCRTTVSNSVANQAVEIIAAMTGNSNVDPDAQS